jgi:CTP:molybdopterin cytidylyltransferase MocA
MDMVALQEVQVEVELRKVGLDDTVAAEMVGEAVGDAGHTEMEECRQQEVVVADRKEEVEDVDHWEEVDLVL